MAMHGLVPLPWLAAALAVVGAVAAMSMARCLHPPAGGTALLTALPAPVVAAAGPAFLLTPLLLNVTILLAAGFTWNRLTGHTYPHRAAQVPPPAGWLGQIEDQDVDEVLAEWDELLDISRDDLLALIHAVEAKVRDRAGIR
jgi:CBS domain-containing membrane protein